MLNRRRGARPKGHGRWRRVGPAKYSSTGMSNESTWGLFHLHTFLELLTQGYTSHFVRFLGFLPEFLLLAPTYKVHAHEP